MDPRETLRALTDLAESLGIEMRPAPKGEAACEVAGALIRLKGREILFLDAKAPLADQIRLLADALRGRDELDNRFLPPHLREIIEHRGP